jgi:Tol biopolymer transport system component
MGSGGDPKAEADAAAQANAGNTYAEFRLRIERGPKRRVYRIVASGPGGQVESSFKLPFSDLELENFVLKVGGTRQGVRSLESPEMDLAKSFGTKLFDALFDTDIRSLYRASTVEATNAGQGLRITLALSSVPELLRVPWEYLYDKPLFPSTDRRTPIIRYLDLPKPIKPFKIQLPLRILAIVSAPTDVPAIDGAQERAKLEAALAPLLANGSVEIDWLEDANLSALFKLLSKKDRAPYHILHFIGHGGYANEAKEGVLLFEGKDGKRQNETGDKLGAILHGEESLRLAVLNSCEGARASLNDPFSSVATSLIEYEIPAVIGMQFEITDRAAILFSGEFYAALADGRAVDEALSQARMAIFADNNDIEWGTPVLFMRVTDGRLFDVRAPVAGIDQAAEAERKRLAEEAAAAAEAGAERRRLEEEEAARAKAEQEGEAERKRLEEAAVEAEAERKRLEQEAAAAQADAQRKQAADEAVAAEVDRQRAAVLAAADEERRRLAQEAEEQEQRRIAAAVEEASKRREAETAAEAQLRKDAERRRRRRIAAVVGTVVGVPLLLLLVFWLPSIGTSISVSAPPGGAADAVRVTGKGFQAGETVNLEIGTVLVGTAIAADDGTIDATVNVPADETSPILVSATGQSSQRLAFGPFDLVAAATGSVQPTGTDVGPTPSEVQPSPSEASVTPPPVLDSKIVFYSNYDPTTNETDTEIYTIDPVTQEVSDPLTTNHDEDTFPTWSPDHTQIAFTRGPMGGRDIYVMDANGENERSLVTDAADDWFPAWSRDGTIAFVRGTREAEIWTVREGEEPQLLADPPPGTYLRSPAWSPDGSELVVWGDPEQPKNYDLYILHLDGGLDRLTSDHVVDRNPTWSPDGTTLAFVRDSDGDLNTREDNEIYLYDRATGGLKQITTNAFQDGNPVWSPDGQQIAFYRGSSRGYHIRVIGRDDKASVDLMEGRPGVNLDPNWR